MTQLSSYPARIDEISLPHFIPSCECQTDFDTSPRRTYVLRMLVYLSTFDFSIGSNVT